MSDSEEDDDDVMTEEQERALEQARSIACRNGGARRSVLCAEPTTVAQGWRPPVYQKDQQQRELISRAVAGSFLFSSLRPEVREQVIDAFRGPIELERGSKVIGEGANVGAQDAGLYVLASGKLEVFKAPAGCPDIRPGNMVVTYDQPGQVFGELALLYNCPRAASVFTATDAVLWSLDRDTFNNCVKGANMGARSQMQVFLSSVEILKGISLNDREKLVDVMEQRDYKPGEHIIRRGEAGAEFFLLMSGRALAVVPDGSVVQTYVPGSYFGELALLQGGPRAVDVVACENSGASCATLSGESFRRLLGPLSQEMAQRAKGYAELRGPPKAASPLLADPFGIFGCCSCTVRSPTHIQQVSKA